MPRDDLQQLLQHIDNGVPQPAHTIQIAARSVERAVGASHGTTGWACKAPGRAADLQRLQFVSRSPHTSIFFSCVCNQHSRAMEIVSITIIVGLCLLIGCRHYRKNVHSTYPHMQNLAFRTDRHFKGYGSGVTSRLSPPRATPPSRAGVLGRGGYNSSDSRLGIL
jgi:hypothetical protein